MGCGASKEEEKNEDKKGGKKGKKDAAKPEQRVQAGSWKLGGKPVVEADLYESDQSDDEGPPLDYQDAGPVNLYCTMVEIASRRTDTIYMDGTKKGKSVESEREDFFKIALFGRTGGTGDRNWEVIGRQDMRPGKNGRLFAVYNRKPLDRNAMKHKAPMFTLPNWVTMKTELQVTVHSSDAPGTESKGGEMIGNVNFPFTGLVQAPHRVKVFPLAKTTKTKGVSASNGKIRIRITPKHISRSMDGSSSMVGGGRVLKFQDLTGNNDEDGGGAQGRGPSRASQMDRSGSDPGRGGEVDPEQKLRRMDSMKQGVGRKSTFDRKSGGDLPPLKSSLSSSSSPKVGRASRSESGPGRAQSSFAGSRKRASTLAS